MRRQTLFASAITFITLGGSAGLAVEEGALFDGSIRPLLQEYCTDCHSTEEQKGDLDLERFDSFEMVREDADVWELVEEQLELGEMPPKKKAQLSKEQKEELLGWVRGALGMIARENAGDPGPVVVRRLSNAEYTYTLRDITGVDTLNPAKEFPVDGAAGEGFTNAGAALVMSPALFSKYFEAAKQAAEHLVLLPDGIVFSEKNTRRDWTDERVSAIRKFYGRFTRTGGGTPVDLQGIKFDTKDGGVLDLEKYFLALLEEKDKINGGRKAPAAVARERGLNAKYLGLLWEGLEADGRRGPLGAIRGRWSGATPADAPALAAEVGRWQAALWKFETVGQIGKRGGAKAWQVPVTPLVSSREIRVKLPDEIEGGEVTVYLVASDAGDGATGDVVVWDRPQIISPDRPPVTLQAAEDLARKIGGMMESELGRTAEYLEALREAHSGGEAIEEVAGRRKLNRDLAARWASLAGLGRPSLPEVSGHYVERAADIGGHAALKGWGRPETPSMIANSSDEAISVSTLVVPAHGLTIHPSPTREAEIYWRSPVEGEVRIEGLVADADGNCGNGVAWRIELIGREGAAEVAEGAIDNGGRKEVETAGPFRVLVGDLVKLAINAKGNDHVCDSTYVSLTITQSDGGKRVWDLGKQVAGRVHDGNPLADLFGNADVWHLCCSDDDGGGKTERFPAGSALSAWRAAVVEGKPDGEVQAATRRIREILEKRGAADTGDANRALVAVLTDWTGPLGWMKLADISGGGGDGGYIEVKAPAVLAYRIPAEIAAGAEFVTTAKLHAEKGREGSVQVSVRLTPPSAEEAAGADPGAPITVADGGEAERRIGEGFQRFRDLFPAALCYTKIVPVDEVVTLTLFYREDDQLRRLMLDETEAAELDRLWSELHFVAEDALTLVDAYEQLWQYATQDADPSVLTPMREPILNRAEAFREAKLGAEPEHLDRIVMFAAKAWRRPLSGEEQGELRALYKTLRNEELGHDAAIRLTLARILAAPAFLYKLESPEEGRTQSPVGSHELATRLSYFLWSSAPDAKLTALAESGELTDPEVLAGQVRRMVGDGRVRRLASEFGSQWLHVRDFDQFDEKSERHFPEFAGIRGALNEEPIRFFTDLFQSDGSVLDIVGADYVVADVQLANYYGLDVPEVEGWNRIGGVRSKGRGGVLGFGATLAKQSGASRTSPILRGAWISETLLGERLPRPPKDVPALPEEPAAGLTERELTERHSSDPGCARCHARIDPFGFSLENYDAIGRYRSVDASDLEIDSGSVLADGTEIGGIDGLRDYLLNQRRGDFVRQYCRKLLGYALGRGVLLSDAPLLDEMRDRLSENGYRVGLAIEMIVRSRQFREIRGRDFEAGN